MSHNHSLTTWSVVLKQDGFECVYEYMLHSLLRTHSSISQAISRLRAAMNVSYTRTTSYIYVSHAKLNTMRMMPPHKHHHHHVMNIISSSSRRARAVIVMRRIVMRPSNKRIHIHANIKYRYHKTPSAPRTHTHPPSSYIVVTKALDANYTTSYRKI